MIKATEWKKTYPMDFYSNNGDIWTNYYHTKKEREERECKR